MHKTSTKQPPRFAPFLINGARMEEPDNLPTTTTPFLYITIQGEIPLRIGGATHCAKVAVLKRCDECDDGIVHEHVYYNEQHSTREAICQTCDGEKWIEIDDGLCAHCACAWVVTGSAYCGDCLSEGVEDRPLDAEKFRVEETV